MYELKEARVSRQLRTFARRVAEGVAARWCAGHLRKMSVAMRKSPQVARSKSPLVAN
jgi:hypothetical protein